MSRARVVVAVACACACGPISGVPLGGDPSSPGTSSSGTTADTWHDSGGMPGDCMLPTLDDFTLGQVYIDAGPFNELARGTARQLRLATALTAVTEPVDACVSWSIAPESAGATISSSGYLSIEADTAVGLHFVVTADIEDGRRIVELDVVIYEPIATPILGYWSESLRIPCETDAPFIPEQPVGELVFLDNSDFRVTWTPFESYVDYWGTFVHDPSSGALSMVIEGGNTTPADFDGSGFATVEGGVLTLDGVFLGSAPGRNPVTSCGHLFQ